MRWLLGGLALLLTAHPSSVLAQLDGLQPGMRVRIIAPPAIPRRADVRFSARHSDTLTFLRDDGAWRFDVPVSSLTSLELYQGKNRWQGARNAARYGVVIGFALGLITAGDSGSSCITDTPQSDVNCVLTFTLAGAFYGGVFGLFRGGDRWESVVLPSRAAPP